MIELKAIKKQYDRCVALDKISLNLEYGNTYGLWGRNGAGKTTLIRIVLGVLTPDHGTVRVFGRDPGKNWSVRREIGIVSDEDECFPELTVEEFLWWIGKLRSIRDDLCQEQTERYTKAFGIGEHRNHLIGSLSHGTRRKISVISAFVGEPRLVVMDEPTNGLDVDSIEALCRLLKKHRDEGRAALVACHAAAFVKEVCTHIVEIDKGKIVQHGPLGTLDIRFSAL